MLEVSAAPREMTKMPSNQCCEIMCISHLCALNCHTLKKRKQTIMMSLLKMESLIFYPIYLGIDCVTGVWKSTAKQEWPKCCIWRLERLYMDTVCVGSWTNAGKDCVQQVPHLISLHVSFTGRSSGKTKNWVEPFLSGSLAPPPPPPLLQS